MFAVEESRRGCVDSHRRDSLASAEGLFREIAAQRWRRYDEVRLVKLDEGSKHTLKVHRFKDRLPDDPEGEYRRQRDTREALLQLRAGDFLHRVLELKARGVKNYWLSAKRETPKDASDCGVAAFCSVVRAEGEMTIADFARLETKLIESAIAILEPP